MTDAPERIWLQLGAGDYGTHTWADAPQDWADETGCGEPEYIRADLARQRVKRLEFAGPFPCDGWGDGIYHSDHGYDVKRHADGKWLVLFRGALLADGFDTPEPALEAAQNRHEAYIMGCLE